MADRLARRLGLTEEQGQKIRRIVDEADTNKDGVLTKEEIKAFQDARRGNQPFGQ
jgi:hypothetical protein